MAGNPNATVAGPTVKLDSRAIKILAKSVYRELKRSGYGRSDMVGFTSALLELVTSDLTGEEDTEQ